MKKITIAIDAMGGEKAPFKTIEGINLFYSKNKLKNDFFLIYLEMKKKIDQELNKYKISQNCYKIYHTTSAVADDETPITAIKNSKNSSMWNSVFLRLTL